MGSNVAEPLRPRILLSVPAPKIAEPREGGLASIGVRTRPIIPLHPRSYFLLWLPVTLFEVQLVFHPWIQAGDLLRSSQSLGAEVSVPTDVPPSGAGQVVGAQVGLSVLTSGLTTVQAEEIFLLSRKVQTLRGKLALDFIKMSHTEATFRMGAQAASHESTVQESCAGETWLHINSLLFRHAIDHQKFMARLIDRSQEAIQALHDRIWKVVRQVMESAARSAADGIGITLHLVGLLPTIPLQLAFNTVTPEPPGYTPKVLTPPKTA